MKPRLYEAGTLEFNNNGIGILADAVSCRVLQESGTEELEMEYPAEGTFSKELTHKRLILAKPEPLREEQPYSIYRITKGSGAKMKVYARHVAYDLQGHPVRPFTAGTSQEAVAGLKANAMTEHPFSFWTDVEKNGTFTAKVPTAAWNLLGGMEGSILDIYHGEYEFDRYTVRLRTRRGADRGVSIRYGKNLQTLEQDNNCEGCYTGVVAYWVDTQTGDSVYAEPVMAEGSFGYTRVLPVDMTSKFEVKPTAAQLQEQAAQYIRDNNIGEPNVSLDVKFVALDQTVEYGDRALLERVQFGDTVHVFFPKIGIDVASRVVKTDFDSLAERYNTVTIGKVKSSMADLFVKQQQEIQRKPEGTALQLAIRQATAAILGARGGAARLLDTDGDGMTDTIYVADNADPNLAKQVWRWNYAGWGVSKNGYNGPFLMAATLDGGFVADFITAGILRAELVKAGVLSDGVGANYWDMETGDFRLSAGVKFGDKTLQKAINDSAAGAVDAQTQQDIANRLFKIGCPDEVKGIAYLNGELYVNGSFINAGEIDANVVKVKNLNADEINTGKLKVDFLDVDNLVTRKLKATAEYNGYTVTVETDEDGIQFTGNDGTVSELLASMGIKEDDENYATANGYLELHQIVKGTPGRWVRVGPTEFTMGGSTVDDNILSFYVADDGRCCIMTDSIGVTGLGNCKWEYISAIDKTVLVLK